jgi:hypothetical protein
MPGFGWVFRRNPVEGCRFRQIRRPAHGTLYLQKITSLVSKSLDWVVNIGSLVTAQVRPVFNLGKDAAPPSGGSIMTTHLSNHAGTPSSASTDTASQEIRRQQSPWSGVEASKLREALAEVAKATKPSAPAIDFGRYVRQEVDRTPDSAAGVLAMGKLLRLDPVTKQVDQLQARVQEIERAVGPREPAISPEEGSRGSSPCERLMKLWTTESGQHFLRTARNIELIAKRINKGVTVTKASPFFKSKVAPARNAHKSYMKLEANAAKDRADRERAEAIGRGGRRRQNRPRIRPTK